MKINKEIRDFYLKTRKLIKNGQLDFFPIYVFFFISFLALGLVFIFPDYLIFTSKKTNGIYREGVYEDVKTLTPYLTTNDTEKTIANIIFPSLFENYNGKIISKFLKSYLVNKEKTEIQITLKDNLYWANGEKLTTEDIRFGLEFAKKFAPSEISRFFSQLEFKIINESQGVFISKFPDNYLIYNLVYLKPLPVKVFSHYSPDFYALDLAQNGFGPFVLKEVRNNKKKIIVLERNKYFPEKVYLKRIEFHIFKDQKEALTAFFTKEIDALAGINYFNLPSGFKKRIRIYKIVLPRVIGIFFNQQKIKANEIVDFLNANLDRQEIVKNVFNNYAEKSEGIFSPSVRKILNLKGVEVLSPQKTAKPQFDFTLILPNSFYYPDLARYLKSKFKIDFVIVSRIDLNEIIKNKDYQALLYGINYGYPPNLAYFFSQTGINLNNSESKILEKEILETKINPAKDIFSSQQEIEKIILDQKSNIFLVNPYYLYLVDKKFEGFDIFFVNDFSERFVKIQNIYSK